MRTHAAVWIDHEEARVFHVEPEQPGHVQPEPVDESTIVAPKHLFHRHPKGRGDPTGHPEDAAHFFRTVAHSLGAADTVLIVGPASAKQEFANYLERHDPRLRAKVAGIETLDRKTDREIVAYARRYFKGSDRM
jgi:stalled ribosome rescue protein Dom34